MGSSVTYLDDNGNPIHPEKVYLDENGEPFNKTLQAPRGDAFGAMADQVGTIANNVAQGGVGLAKSVPQTALGLGQAIRSLLGAQVGTQGVAQELAGASNPEQQAGVDVGKLLQFLIPAAATGGGSLAAQALGQGAAAGALGAGQSGKFGPEAAATGIAGAAGPLAGKVLEAGASLAPRMINSLVKPVSQAFEFGKNPGRGVVREGIVANSLEDLGTKVTAKASDLGRQVDSMLKGVTKKVDISTAFQPIDDAIQGAVKGGDEALLGRLRQLKEQMTQDFAEVLSTTGEGTGKLISTGTKPTQLTPLEANQFKRDIGDLVKWRQGDMYADDVNAIGKKVWANITAGIEKAVPGVKSLNGRWADLITAEKAIARRAIIEQRHDLVGLPDIGLAGLGGGLGLLGGGLSGAGMGAALGSMAKTAMGSTAAKTTAAQALANGSPQLAALIRALLPGLTSAAVSSPSQTQEGK